MFYKDELHESQTNELLNEFGLSNLTANKEYGAFAYMVAATYKIYHIKECITESNSIDLEKLYKKIEVFSESEECMIRFGLQCFNSRIDDITLSSLMFSLDEQNNLAVKQAINIRY